MLNLGQLLLELGISDEQFYAQLERARVASERVGQQIEKNLQGVNLQVKVDDRQLTDLNKHFDVKMQHHKQVQRQFDQNPLTVKVDDRQLTELNKKLAALKSGSVSVNVSARNVGGNSSSSRASSTPETDRLVREIARQGTNIVRAIASQGGQSVAGAAGSIASAPIRAVGSLISNTVGSVATGALEKVGRDLASELSSGLSSGLRQELSFTLGSLEYLGEQVGRDVIKGIVDALGREGQAVERAIADVVGQANIDREGAAVRGVAANARGARRGVARQQAARELGFVEGNLGEIRGQAQQAGFDRGRLELSTKRLEARIQETAAKLGQAAIDAQIKEIDASVDALAKELEGEQDPSKVNALSQKASTLAARRATLVERVVSIRTIAERQFDEELQTIDRIDADILARERQIQRYERSVDNARRLGVSATRGSSAAQEALDGASNPDRFNEIARQVAQRSGVSSRQVRIPNLVESQGVSGFQAQYVGANNQIEVPPELYAAIKTGELSAKQIETLVHEMRHAIQLGFGQNRIADGAVDGVDLLRPNREESRALGRRIEASVGDGSSPQRRDLEQDAYVFADRFAKEIGESIRRQRLSDNFSRQVGTGGGRLENQVLSARNTAARFVLTQRQAGIGSNEGVDNALDTIDQIYKGFSADIDSLVNVDLIPTEEIESAGRALNARMRESVEELKRVAKSYGQITADFGQEAERELVPLQGPENQRRTRAEVSRTGSASDVSQQRTRINRQTYAAASNASRVLAPSISADADIKEAIAETDRLSEQFKGVYATFRNLVKDGDIQKVSALRDDIARYGKAAQASIDNAIAQAKSLDVPDAALVNRLGGAKGRIGRSVKQSNQAVLKLQREQESSAARASVARLNSAEDESLQSVEDIAGNVRDYLKGIQETIRQRLRPDFAESEVNAINANASFDQNQGRFERAENAINNNAARAEAGLGAATAGLEAGGTESLGDRIQRIFTANGGNEKAAKAIGLVTGAVSQFTGTLGLLGVAAVGFRAFQVIGQQATAAAVAINNAERRLKLALGSLQAAQTTIADIRAASNELGTNATADIAGATRLQIASRGTSLAGNNAANLAEAVQQASSVFSLNPQEQEQAFRALEQSISKGKISAEELRGQLGEVLPGAFQISARAIGVTTEELDRMLAAGEVLSSDLLPKLANQLKSENFEGLADSASTYTAALNRASNANTQFLEESGQFILPAQTVGLNSYAKAVNFLTKNVEVVTVTLGSLAAAIGIISLKAIASSALFTAIWSALAAAATATAATIAAVLGPVLAIIAAVAAVLGAAYIAWEAFGNSSGVAGKTADTTARAFKEMSKELDDVTSAADRAGTALRSVNRGEIGDNEGLRAQGITDIFRGIPILKRLSNNRITNQREGTVREVGEQVDAGNAIIRRGQIASAQDEFEEYRRLEEQIAQVRSQRESANLINPEDLDAIREFTKLEAELIEQQSDISAIVTAPQAYYDIAISNAESAIDGLEEALVNRNIGELEFEQGTADLRQNIDDLEAAQKAFNDRLSQGNRQYQDIIRNAERLAAANADANTAFEQQSAQQRLAIANNPSITDEDRAFREALISKSEADNKLAANAQAIAEVEADLQSREIRRVTDTLPFGTFGENTGAAEIDRLLSATDNADTEAALTLLRRLKELQAESINLAESQSRAIGDVLDQIRETDEAIQDYYEQLTDDIQELQFELDAASNDSTIAQVKSDIFHAIEGTSDNLLSGLGDLIVAQVEALNEEATALMDYQRGQASINARQVEGLAGVAAIRDGILTQQSFPGAQGGAASIGGPGIAAAQGGTNIQVTRTGQSDDQGLEILRLDLIDELGNILDTVLGNSGVASTQGGYTAESARNAAPGSLAPIPTGSFGIGATTSSADPGVDGFFVPLSGAGDNVAGRGAFGIHNDANRLTSPGSAGCIVLYEPAAESRVKAWLENQNAPRELTVSYAPSPVSGIAISAPQSAQSESALAANAADIFSGGDNSLAIRAIGYSEGNRTVDGGFTGFYDGHIDPGNGAFNIGSVSSQGENFSSPQEADAVWLDRLQNEYLPQFMARAEAVGLQNNQQVLINFLDLAVQAPLAATAPGGFLDQLSTIAAQGVTNQSLVNARVQSFVNPDTGQLEASGFGNSASRLATDQQRRIDALAQVAGTDSSVGGAVSGGGGFAINNLAQQYADAGIQARQTGQAAGLDEQVLQRTAVGLQTLETNYQTALLNSGVAIEAANRRTQELFTQAAESSRQIDLQNRREREDLKLSTLADTPENELRRARVQIERQREDYLSNLEENRITLQNSIQSADAAIVSYQSLLDQGLISSDAANQGITDASAFIVEASGSLRNVVGSIDEAGEQFDILIQQAEDTAARAIDARGFANRQRRAGLETEFTQEVTIRGLNEQGLGFQAIEEELFLRIGNIELDREQAIRSIQEQVDSGLLDEIEAAGDFAQLNELFDTRADVAREQVEELGEALRRLPTDKLFEVEGGLLGAQGERANIFGIDQRTVNGSGLEARAIEENQRAFDADVLSFTEAAREAGVAEEEIRNVQRAMLELNEVRLDNIRAEFDEWTPAINIARDATEGLFSSLFDRTKTVGDAFLDFFDNIISSFGQLASKQITDGLFGGLLGFAPSDGGQGSSIFGTIASIFGFNEGTDSVPGDPAHQVYRSGYGEISKALQREGPNSVLAALTPGEMVLTPTETASYLEYKRVFNFASGGVVPGARTPVTASAAPMSINIGGISTTVNGGTASGIDQAALEARLRRDVQFSVQDEIRRQQGLGGSLNQEN